MEETLTIHQYYNTKDFETHLVKNTSSINEKSGNISYNLTTQIGREPKYSGKIYKLEKGILFDDENFKLFGFDTYSLKLIKDELTDKKIDEKKILIYEIRVCEVEKRRDEFSLNFYFSLEGQNYLVCSRFADNNPGNSFSMKTE